MEIICLVLFFFLNKNKPGCLSSSNCLINCLASRSLTSFAVENNLAFILKAWSCRAVYSAPPCRCFSSSGRQNLFLYPTSHVSKEPHTLYSRYHWRDFIKPQKLPKDVETVHNYGTDETPRQARRARVPSRCSEIPVVGFILLHLLLLVSVPVLQLLLRLLPPLSFCYLRRWICGPKRNPLCNSSRWKFFPRPLHA